MPDTVKFLASVLTKHTISMASANKLSSIFIDMCQQVEQRHKLSVRDVHHLAVCGTLSDIAHQPLCLLLQQQYSRVKWGLVNSSMLSNHRIT
jgi:hypothetical protein